MKIAIAGAFGFVGKHLIEHLLQSTDHEIVAFSRQAKQQATERLKCVTVDLYSLKEAMAAFTGCDVAVYLVHSMAPHARLSQGHFRDFDFILADNFARAAKAKHIKSIVYVGGMIPAHGPLSPHLISRLEVEDVLRSHSIPVTALRCGLAIGPEGSSFNIIVRLVKRLPAMILPQWMRTESNPIYVGDLVRAVVASLENPSPSHRIFDVGMDRAVSYKQIVQLTARELNKRPFLIDFPLMSPALSKLWVRLVSGAPKALVYPLIDSVEHEMLKDPSRSLPSAWHIKVLPLEEAIHLTFKVPFTFKPPGTVPAIKELSEVRSVQRMEIPEGKSVTWVASAYMKWCPLLLRPFIKVVSDQDICEYHLRFPSKLLLRLRLDPTASRDDRQLYRIEKGLLVAKGNRGRFEFRKSPSHNFLIVALHNYKPSLPWPLYRSTQAFVHSALMRSFARYLSRQSTDNKID